MESKPIVIDTFEDMSHVTSVTVDEAILIMLGFGNGPLPRPVLDDRLPDEVRALYEEPFDIFEAVPETLTKLQQAYDNAETDGSPKEVIEKARQELEEFESRWNEKGRWFSEISDELGKGGGSELRIDKERSTDHLPYITLWSLKEWADRKGYENGIFKSSLRGRDVQKTPDATAVGLNAGAPQKPATRRETKGMRQEKAILDELKRQTHDPKNIPKRGKETQGRDWVKADIRAALDGHDPFESSSAFDRIWNQLRSKKKIAEADS